MGFFIFDRLRSYFLGAFALFQFFLYPFSFMFWFIILQPLRLCVPKLYHACMDRCYVGFCHGIGAWNDFAGHSIYECGDDISKVFNDKKVFILNHQSIGDIAVLCRALHNRNFPFTKTMYIMDWVMQFLPFGFVCLKHGDFFILQPSDVKRYSMLCGCYLKKRKDTQEQSLLKLMKDNFFSRNFNTIAIFPEGGLLKNRKASSQKYGKANGYPHLEYVTLPRVNGFLTIMNSLQLICNSSVLTPVKPQSSSGSANFSKVQSSDENNFKWIVDITIAYPHSNFNVGKQFCRSDGQRSKVVLNYKIFACDDLYSADDDLDLVNEKMKDWIIDRFTEKDRILSHFYEKGYFPSYQNDTKPVPKLNCKHIFLFHFWALFTLSFIVCAVVIPLVLYATGNLAVVV